MPRPIRIGATTTSAWPTYGRTSGTLPVTTIPGRELERPDRGRWMGANHIEHCSRKSLAYFWQNVFAEPHHGIDIRPIVHLAGEHDNWRARESSAAGQHSRARNRLQSMPFGMANDLRTNLWSTVSKELSFWFGNEYASVGFALRPGDQSEATRAPHDDKFVGREMSSLPRKRPTSRNRHRRSPRASARVLG